MTRYEFELPDPGEGLTEAELVEWHVAEGDDIEEHDVLCEVETDKAVTDVPSPCPGTIEERTAEVGDIVQVSEVLVVIETDAPPSGEAEAEVAKEATEEADEVIALQTPQDFRAVGQYYRDFGQVSDEEAMTYLDREERPRE